MVTLGLLGRNYRQQLEANPEGLEGVAIAWHFDYLGQLLPTAEKPKVVVVDLDLLDEENPVRQIEELLSRFEPELLLVVYRYVKREVLKSFAEPRVRTIQGPLSLTNLRSQMLSLIVRDMFASQPTIATATGASSRSEDLITCPRCGERVPAARARA